MSLQAFQQLRDSDAAAFKRIAALEAELAELKRQIEAMKRPTQQTLTLPKKAA